MEDLSLLLYFICCIYTIISLFPCGLMNIYPLGITQRYYNEFFFFAQVVLALAISVHLSGWLLCSLRFFFFSNAFLLSDTAGYSRLMYFPCTSPRIGCSSRVTGSFHRRMVCKNKHGFILIPLTLV